MKNISIHFVPFERFHSMETDEMIELIIEKSKKNQILVVEGKLGPVDETSLIETTMENIDKKFKGIEICSLNSNGFEKTSLSDRIRDFILETIYGKKRGLTIIGPASIIKQIKRDPDSIILKMK